MTQTKCLILHEPGELAREAYKLLGYKVYGYVLGNRKWRMKPVIIAIPISPIALPLLT